MTPPGTRSHIYDDGLTGGTAACGPTPGQTKPLYRRRECSRREYMLLRRAVGRRAAARELWQPDAEARRRLTNRDLEGCVHDSSWAARQQCDSQDP
jgi:hypothetical protein